MAVSSLCAEARRTRAEDMRCERRLFTPAAVNRREDESEAAAAAAAAAAGEEEQFGSLPHLSPSEVEIASRLHRDCIEIVRD